MGFFLLYCSFLHLKRRQEKYTEAIPLLERALSIRTQRLGGNHPQTIRIRGSLELLRTMVTAQRIDCEKA